MQRNYLSNILLFLLFLSFTLSLSLFSALFSPSLNKNSEYEVKMYWKSGDIGGNGFGTCKKIVHCTKCQFSDIPKIIDNILSCLVWTISPIVLIILLLYTGIGMYFSFGSKETIEKAKSLWKAVGIGWLIMLFAWNLLDLIFKFFELK